MGKTTDQGMGSVILLGAWASYERPLRPGLIQMAAYELVGTPPPAGLLRITDEVAG
jgi:hypothetical protein